MSQIYISRARAQRQYSSVIVRLFYAFSHSSLTLRFMLLTISSQTFNNTTCLMLMTLFLNNAMIPGSENFVC